MPRVTPYPSPKRLRSLSDLIHYFTTSQGLQPCVAWSEVRSLGKCSSHMAPGEDPRDPRDPAVRRSYIRLGFLPLDRSFVLNSNSILYCPFVTQTDHFVISLFEPLSPYLTQPSLQYTDQPTVTPTKQDLQDLERSLIHL